MNFKFEPFDKEHFASHLTQHEGTLKWNAHGQSHSLVIRTDYARNVDITKLDKTLFEKLTPAQFGTDKDKEIALSTEYSVTIVQKGYVNNFPITVLPATYAVFSCILDSTNDSCTVFVPNEACHYQCCVASQVNVTIRPAQIKKLLKAPVRYYVITVPDIPKYTDGSLYYTFPGLNRQFPITKSMLGKPFYVLNCGTQKPIIASNKGNSYQIVYS